MATLETGTQILARARILAQDNDINSNFAVGAADCLILLNDVLISLNNNSNTKSKWIGASVSGLSFSASDATKVSAFISSDPVITEIESFHQSNSSTFSLPATPAIERIPVQEMLTQMSFNGDTALTQGGSEWTLVAAEKNQVDTSGAATALIEQWRVYAWPVINRTRYIHLKVPVPVTISAITNCPDIDAIDTRLVSRLLAYEIAKLKKETSQAFMDNILRGIPQGTLDMVYGGAVRGSQLQTGITQVEY